MVDVDARLAEIRQENHGGDVSFRDVEWLCDEVARLLAVLKEQAGQIERLQTVVREHWSPSQAEAILEATVPVARSGGGS